MTEIVNGKLVYNELTKNANGGTELIARKMVRDIDQSLLEGFQIIHSRVRDIDPDLKQILVCHDLPNDPEVAQLADPEYRKQFEKIVFVSNWQQQAYNMVLGVPYNESIVIHNGVDVVESRPRYREYDVDPIRLIYHTTPHRGLNILTSVVKELSKQFNIRLDVYSSFEAYGWGDRDNDFKPLFDELHAMPNVYNHGYVANDVIREQLLNSDIFAYPSTWTETSCLSLMEAKCAGVYCIHSSLGALPETGGLITDMYDFTEDQNRHAANLYRRLLSACVAFNSDATHDFAKEVRERNQNIANSQHDWKKSCAKWKSLLRSLGDA